MLKYLALAAALSGCGDSYVEGIIKADRAGLACSAPSRHAMVCVSENTRLYVCVDTTPNSTSDHWRCGIIPATSLELPDATR